jgi:anti-sigma factor RsiW
MARHELSDETLMAYADGELDADTARAVAAAAHEDESLAARIALFEATRTRAKTALAPLLDEPVPADLHARIAAMVESEASDDAPAAGTVLPFRRRSSVTAAAGARTGGWVTALAASVALFVGGVIGFYVASTAGDDGPPALRVANLDQPGLLEAIRSVPSGEERRLDGGGRFRAIATYRDADGTLCREFEVDGRDTATVVAVACHGGGAWDVPFTVAAGQADGGYAPASSLEALDAYLAAVGAGPPLEPAAEREALSAVPGG